MRYVRVTMASGFPKLERMTFLMQSNVTTIMHTYYLRINLDQSGCNYGYLWAVRAAHMER